MLVNRRSRQAHNGTGVAAQMATEPVSGPRARRPRRLAARRTGNAEADLLRELHQQHAGALWSYALTLTGDRDQAQDVVQETLLRACRNPQIFDPERRSQRSWLYTVATNIVIDEWRTTRRRLPERPNADACEQVVNHHLVAMALGRLPQEHRDVLRECYFRGGSVAQAAHALEIAPDMVKSRAYYALRALRLAIEELGGVQ
jgi:RNA polymerase sigma-70 factor (ECF subfamily)